MKRRARRRAPPRLASWSFSTHKQLQRCPARTKYAKIDKLPDPAGAAAERGNRLHEALERYVKGTGAYPLELLAWRPALDLRIAACGPDAILPELEIALDGVWTPVPWADATVRAKLDLVLVVDDTTIEVIDFKTGRQYDDHAEQLEFYATLAMHRYAWCQRVQVANWYLDRPGEVFEGAYDRADFDARLLPKWKRAVVEDLSRSVWPAQRNPYCRYCPFSSRRGGPCIEG